MTEASSPRSQPRSAPRTLGVLGGMGPAATADFLAKLVALTPAQHDQDHIPTVIYNDPRIPDRTQAVLAGNDAPLEPMRLGLRALEVAGAELCAIPCNTAHHWFDALASDSSLELLHIADAVDAVAGDGEPLGLLATRGTLMAGVYQKRLRARGRTWITPDEAGQAHVDAAIAAVKAGRPLSGGLVQVVEGLLEKGAARIVLACTELPLALEGQGLEAISIDATAALARACVRQSNPDLNERS